MGTRTMAAITASLTLVLGACGGGGSTTMSEADFVDELADICSDAERDLNRIDEPVDGDYATFAKEARAVYDDTLERLQGLEPPTDISKDFDDFVGNIEDQIKDIDKLAGAEDETTALKYAERLSKLADEQSGLARDLDVSDCDPNDGDSPDTIPPSPTTETTPETTLAAPPSSAAPTTAAAPITLPSTVVPVTAPPGTEPPSATGFTVVDLTTIFVAPAGFYLDPTTPTQETIDVIASLPAMNANLLEFGVATLVDARDNTPIADIWVGVSRTDSMPAEWKDLDCPDGGDLRLSAQGIPGIVCYGAADSPTWEIFTATVNAFGLSVYTLVPDVSGDLVADAFLAANPG
jgi:hypothetical protein